MVFGERLKVLVDLCDGGFELPYVFGERCYSSKR
jgi:hypothetical protein